MKESVKSETIKVKPIAMKIILTKFLVENPTKPYTLFVPKYKQK
jgi:hypothetical protein